MKIDQALIGSKIGIFSETRVGSREATAARASGVETEGVPGVVVTVSDDLATDGGRLRTPEPTAAGLFGILASPQSFAVTRPMSVMQTAKAGETLRTNSMINAARQQERVGRGLGAVGNTADPLSGGALFERAGSEARELKVLRGETVADAITSGVELSRSFVEMPAQGLANDQQGTPFAPGAGLQEQFGPKSVSADGFGPLVSSLNAETQFGIPTLDEPLGNQMLSSEEDNELERLGLDPPGPDTLGLGGLGTTDGERQGFNVETQQAGSVREPLEALTGVGLPREAERISQAEEAGTTDDRRELSKAEERVVQELRARDREVREHEQAHVSSAGGLAGSPTYTFTTGPDNVQYAVGGEVSIDMSPGASPEETIEKARTVQRAALAPAEPSAQDRAVAAAASRMEQDAQVEVREQRISEAEQTTAVAVESSEDLANTVAEGVAASSVQSADRGLAGPVVENFDPSPTSLPTEEATVREVNENVRPSLNSEAFQELRTFREREEDVVEVRAGASQRGVADYQRSENAYQAQDDYISVA